MEFGQKLVDIRGIAADFLCKRRNALTRWVSRYSDFDAPVAEIQLPLNFGWSLLSMYASATCSTSWFLTLCEHYFLVFHACLIKMDFSRHVTKDEFHDHQRKGVHKLKWCLKVFMSLRSLSLLYALTSYFGILPVYIMLSKTFTFTSWDNGSFQVFLFTLNLWPNT